MLEPDTRSFWFRSWRPAAVLLFATAGSVPAAAQEPAAAIDALFRWTAPDRPGCAVAVAREGELVFHRAYGSADLERDVAIGPDTVFDAGSVVKQFVASAVLLLVEDGRLALTDDVRTHVPEMPDCGHRITIDHLLTHTSGVRDWTALLRLAATSRDALGLVLRQRGLDHVPGEEWRYSNSGYVLLKEIVARRSGAPFDRFLQERLFTPLGMEATTYRLDELEVLANRALAYEKRGDTWRLAMHLGNERGGQGALFTTARDLARWNDALGAGRLGRFVTDALHEPARLNNGRQIGYGRGLLLDTYRGARLVWHSGGAAGYKTWSGRFPEHGISIAILCNSDEGVERTQLARRIFEVLVPDLPAQRPEAPPIPDAASAPDLTGRAGTFVCERTGTLLRLAVDRGRLRLANGPGLVPLDANRFRRWDASLQFLSGQPFELHFVSQDEVDFRLDGGEPVRHRRARPVARSAAELAAFAGRYRSDELDATIRVTAREGGLDLQVEHLGDGLDFQSVDGDTFACRQLTVHFVRAADENVVAVRYTNPVLRDVRFERLADGG